jgi:putative glutamine amidotransferase
VPTTAALPLDGVRKPLIGISTQREPAQMAYWQAVFALLNQDYIEAVTSSGGVAILLPPQPNGAEEVVAALDGLILSGGPDVDPRLYGRELHQLTGAPRSDRDSWERALLQASLRRSIPVLGICRGMQLLNVELGGTLHQHVPEVVGHTGHRPGLGTFGSTVIATEPGSRTAGWLGPERTVSCHHHQMVDQLAEPLQVTARSRDDGSIEAVEYAGRPFVVAVQWHPEHCGADAPLFDALVEAAKAPYRRGEAEVA